MTLKNQQIITTETKVKIVISDIIDTKESLKGKDAERDPCRHLRVLLSVQTSKIRRVAVVAHSRKKI